MSPIPETIGMLNTPQLWIQSSCMTERRESSAVLHLQWGLQMSHPGGVSLKTPLETAAVWSSEAHGEFWQQSLRGGLISTVLNARSEIMTGRFTSSL